MLGRTGLRVSAVGLGAGPVPALMTGADAAAQREVLARACVGNSSGRNSGSQPK